jgi:hypothetical protein
MMGGLPGDVVDDLACIANKNWVEEQKFPALHPTMLELNSKDLNQALADNPAAVDMEDWMGQVCGWMSGCLGSSCATRYIVAAVRFSIMN